jgi:hypothetical protein
MSEADHSSQLDTSHRYFQHQTGLCSCERDYLAKRAERLWHSMSSPYVIITACLGLPWSCSPNSEVTDTHHGICDLLHDDHYEPQSLDDMASVVLLTRISTLFVTVCTEQQQNSTSLILIQIIIIATTTTLSSYSSASEYWRLNGHYQQSFITWS